jgi:hypothetical protein
VLASRSRRQKERSIPIKSANAWVVQESVKCPWDDLVARPENRALTSTETIAHHAELGDFTSFGLDFVHEGVDLNDVNQKDGRNEGGERKQVRVGSGTGQNERKDVGGIEDGAGHRSISGRERKTQNDER